MGEHSWCVVYEIRAICAVIYGVWLFTPPIKLQRNVLYFLELGTKKQEQRWICFGERSTVYNYELGILNCLISRLLERSLAELVFLRVVPKDPTEGICSSKDFMLAI